jgi:hypothetical protein
MKITIADKSIAWLALLSGLAISAVAVYYSVAGLISIFAAAAIPIAVMGIVLELSKLVATVWLKQNWFIAPRLIKAYLLIAVTILMLITSMGIFGYLSKAHLDQAVPTSDIAAKVALLDEKIKTERDNIDAARRALQQMDSQVDQMLGRSDTERGAERAVQIRRNQAKERASLQSDISKSQKAIAALNQERAPVASELRKVEAEVGPIKYIAALLYGDNPDQNVLERSVRWVIILIVIIFDPLAVVLLLASQYSFQYFRRVKEEEDANTNIIAPPDSIHVDRSVVRDEPVVEQPVEQPLAPIIESQRVDYTSPGPCPHCGKHLIEAKGIDIFCPDADCDYNLTGNPETDAFFKRLRKAAKEIDEGEYEPDDGPLTDEQIQQIEDSVEEQPEMASDLVELQDNQEPYPFPLWRPVEGDAKLLENNSDEEIDELDELDSDADVRRVWKAMNPNDTLKRQRSLYERGLIDNLPWETIKKFDDEVDYKQNSEQSSDSLWQKIQDKKNK